MDDQVPQRPVALSPCQSILDQLERVLWVLPRMLDRLGQSADQDQGDIVRLGRITSELEGCVYQLLTQL